VLINGCTEEVDLNSGIFFWEYNNQLTLEKLISSNNFGDLIRQHKVSYHLQLNNIKQCNWKEQIYLINDKDFDVYQDNLLSQYPSTDEGSFFFSFVIEGEIIYTGLNRLLPSGAAPRPYDLDRNLARIYTTELWNRFGDKYYRISIDFELGHFERQKMEMSNPTSISTIYSRLILEKLLQSEVHVINYL